jgi:hypothetical protein
MSPTIDFDHFVGWLNPTNFTHRISQRLDIVNAGL